ncbi:MAG: carbon monoxide dehydrogenase accessory protein CooC [Dehalococcoidia bacterium]|nr:carbon monoxide dehydrogenase accessory protein CooC [Dehalococcoidia bacterium]
MKLAVSGKGGVGKTTLSSTLARLYAAEGRTVLAIEANPDANLGAAIGFSAEDLRKVRPIAEMSELIEERTGMKPGTTGGVFRINPKVDDIPDRFSISKNGVKLLVMGTVKQGGGGCLCAEGALIRSLVSHLLVSRTEVVIMDMDAGVEHLGRATADSVDAFIVVVEPGRRSIQTAETILALTRDIGIKRCYAVGNKIHNESDKKFIVDNLPDFEVLGFISYSPQIIEADLKGRSPYDTAPQAVQEIEEIKKRLDEAYEARQQPKS